MRIALKIRLHGETTLDGADRPAAHNSLVTQLERYPLALGRGLVRLLLRSQYMRGPQHRAELVLELGRQLGFTGNGRLEDRCDGFVRVHDSIVDITRTVVKLDQ